MLGSDREICLVELFITLSAFFNAYTDGCVYTLNSPSSCTGWSIPVPSLHGPGKKGSERLSKLLNITQLANTKDSKLGPAVPGRDQSAWSTAQASRGPPPGGRRGGGPLPGLRRCPGGTPPPRTRARAPSRGARRARGRRQGACAR